MAGCAGCAFMLLTGFCGFLSFGHLSAVLFKGGRLLALFPCAVGGSVAGALALVVALVLPPKYRVPVWIGLPVVPLAEFITRVAVEGISGGTARWPFDVYWKALLFAHLPLVLCAVVVARLRQRRMR